MTNLILLLSLLFSVHSWAKIPDWLEIGVNTHGAIGEPITQIHQMGARWVRTGLPWHEIETSKGYYDFAYTDIMVRDMKQRGMKILFILAYAPSFWSSNGQSNGVPNAQAWRNFVHAVTWRYKNEVDAWEIWNEPNLTEFFVGTPRQYFDIILKPAYPIIKKNDPDSIVAAPGLATLYSAKPLEFLKKLRSYGGDAYFDVLSHHTYGPDAKSLKRLLTQSVIGKPSVLSMIQQSKFTHKPFWLTEFGCDELRSGSELRQATCLSEQVKFLTTQQWIKNAMIYSLADDPRYLDLFRWGILRSDFSPKPAVQYIKSVLQ